MIDHWWRGAWWAFGGAAVAVALVATTPSCTTAPVTEHVQMQAGVAGAVLGVLWAVLLVVDLVANR